MEQPRFDLLYSAEAIAQRVAELGAQISAASDSGNFSTLLLATVLMATMVVTMNRLVWRRLYRLAETRYKLEG